MPTLKSLSEIYARITICDKKCVGVHNDPTSGVIGRSFYCPFDPSDISLLMVSKNPGQANEEENDIYRPLNGAERVLAHESFVKKCFIGKNNLVTSTYHRNILEWVSIILNTEPEHDVVFKKAALTALVKCESHGEKTDKLSVETIDYCSARFLFNEIKMIKPKYLLALGGEAYKFLIRPEVQSRHCLPVGNLYHPSWSNMVGGVAKYKADDLIKIKKDYDKACYNQ